MSSCGFTARVQTVYSRYAFMLGAANYLLAVALYLAARYECYKHTQASPAALQRPRTHPRGQHPTLLCD